MAAGQKPDKDNQPSPAASSSVDFSDVVAGRDISNVTVGRDIIFNIAKKIPSDTKVIANEQQAAEAAKKYADKYRSRYGSLKLLGMSQGVSLESVYTPVRFQDQLSIRQFESIQGLEEIYRDSQKRRFQFGECRIQDGITVANNSQYLMVLGYPGAGKSTFLRRIGLEAFKGEKGRFQHNCIPVLLELKQFNNTEKVDLVSAITEEFKHFGFLLPKEFAINALEAGKLLVLLDGLDEVSNEFINSVMDAIDNLVTRYEKNRFIASCRIAAYHSNFRHDFQVVELVDFDDDQIKQFIDNWFSSELHKQTKTAEKCWSTLNQENNKAAKELAQTPLLLTFLCFVYSRKLNFPPNRSRLYNKALDILLEEWAVEKRIQQEEIYEGLHTDLEKLMLAKIAYQGFIKDQLFFSRQQLVDGIRDFLADTVDNPKTLDVQKILNSIVAQQGILVERAEDIYSFSHLTLQEYLTAQYISQKDSRIQELVTKCLSERRWREVFLLVAGLKDDAGELLKLMETATQQYINTQKLQNLLDWVERVTDTSAGDLQPVGKRALALAYAYAYAYADVDAEALKNATLLATCFVVFLNADTDTEANVLSKLKLVIAQSFVCANIHNNALANALALTAPQVDTKTNADSFVLALALVKATATATANASAVAYMLALSFTKANIDALANALANAYAYALEKLTDNTRWSEKFQIYRGVDYSQLISALEKLKQQIPGEIGSGQVHRIIAQQFIQTWLQAFHLTPEMLDLSQSEIKALDNYFYANLLMVECKKAAVLVSKETWSEIESRMLLPVREV
ncbi:MAG: NACHT domain-containing protein [Pleurocapsa sp. MO_226.B13]|nr:NACHT domain-containing protein [Pleurocapsa sp. MO_226.B13]